MSLIAENTTFVCGGLPLRVLQSSQTSAKEYLILCTIDYNMDCTDLRHSQVSIIESLEGLNVMSASSAIFQWFKGEKIKSGKNVSGIMQVSVQRSESEIRKLVRQGYSYAEIVEVLGFCLSDPWWNDTIGTNFASIATLRLDGTCNFSKIRDKMISARTRCADGHSMSQVTLIDDSEVTTVL